MEKRAKIASNSISGRAWTYFRTVFSLGVRPPDPTISQPGGPSDYLIDTKYDTKHAAKYGSNIEQNMITYSPPHLVPSTGQGYGSKSLTLVSRDIAGTNLSLNIDGNISINGHRRVLRFEYN